MAYELKVEFSDIMNIYSKNHKVGNKNGIKRAYHFAEEKHAGVNRGSGEPYINHVLRAARSVAEWGAESDVIMAALLHDVVEDCDVTLADIEKQFGSNVADIVDAVTALSDKDFTDHTLTKAQKDLLADPARRRFFFDRVDFFDLIHHVSWADLSQTNLINIISRKHNSHSADGHLHDIIRLHLSLPHNIVLFNASDFSSTMHRVHYPVTNLQQTFTPY